MFDKFIISKKYLSNFSRFNEKYENRTSKKKLIINKDLFNLKFGQKISNKIMMTNEKLPALCPDNKENIILIEIKIRARVLYFNLNTTIKKEIQKNNIPILWINGPFNGFLNGHSKELWSVKAVSTPIKRKIKIIDIKFAKIAK